MLMNKIKTRFSIRTMLLGLLACSMMSCSDNLDIQIVGIKGEPHDPSKPIEVTDYSPKEGSAGQKMVVYGKNFGTDPSIIKVAVGGAEAVVVSACGDAIYCLLPSKTEANSTPEFLNPEEDDEVIEEAQADDAVEGENADARTVWVAVGPQGSMKTAKAEASFSYVKAWKVRTIAGEVNEKNEIVFLDGPFGNCGNFANAENFCVDPVNPDLVWISGDNSSPGTNVRLIDLKNKTVTTLFKDPSWLPDPKRVRWVDFTTDGEYNMLIAFDSWSADVERPGVAVLKRDWSKDGIEAFAEEAKNPFILVRSFFVNGVVAHPKSNSLFFNCYSTTGVYKFPDHTKYPELKGNPKGIYHLMEEEGRSAYQAQDCQLQYSFGERSWEFVMHMHPTGKYMIGVHVNGTGFLSKAFYNEEEDIFVQPGAFVNSNGTMGLGGSSGYLDGVGLNARIYNPREGCFVYNPEYAGQEDEYDFYFTDSGNHCIRKVTPQGVVTTFAGRGTNNYASNAIGNSSGAKGYADGLARGEALFSWPRSIAYLESRNSFIIGDCDNKRIREIYFE